MRSKLVLLGALLLLSACGGVEGPKECTTSDECFENYACDVAVTKICLRVCADDSECVSTTQICDVPTGSTEGMCRGGSRGGGDVGPGGD